MHLPSLELTGTVCDWTWVGQVPDGFPMDFEGGTLDAEGDTLDPDGDTLDPEGDTEDPGEGKLLPFTSLKKIIV